MSAEKVTLYHLQKGYTGDYDIYEFFLSEEAAITRMEEYIDSMGYPFPRGGLTEEENNKLIFLLDLISLLDEDGYSPLCEREKLREREECSILPVIAVLIDGEYYTEKVRVR